MVDAETVGLTRSPLSFFTVKLGPAHLRCVVAGLRCLRCVRHRVLTLERLKSFGHHRHLNHKNASKVPENRDQGIGRNGSVKNESLRFLCVICGLRHTSSLMSTASTSGGPVELFPRVNP